MTAELTGGRVSYYLATVLHPQREDQPAYTAECEDIIQALKMDFNEACEFKAIWRTAAARLGNGKSGQKALYDAEKRLHYAGRSVRELRLAAQQPETRVSRDEHTGNHMPEKLNTDSYVLIRLASGVRPIHSQKAHEWDWRSSLKDNSITHWRYAKAEELP